MRNLNLKKLRKQIDKVDQKLIKFLKKRLEITKKIGIYKKIYQMPPCDREREKNLFQKIKISAEKLNLDPELIKKIFEIILKKVKKDHRKIKK